MGKVGVEGDAVAGGQLVLLAVAMKPDCALLDQRDLATAGLVHRRIAATARARARGKPVQRDLGPLTGQRRGEDLVAVAAGRRALAALAAPHYRNRSVFVESQQLG